MLKQLAAVLLCVALSASLLYASSTTLTYDLPLCNAAPCAAGTGYTDGSPFTLAMVAGTTVYYNLNTAPTISSTKLWLPVSVLPAATTMTYTFTGLTPGKWVFAVTVTDTLGSESALSNAVLKTILVLPNAPKNLVIPGGVNYV